MIVDYLEFDLLTDDVTRVGDDLHAFTVRVLDSPIGGGDAVVRQVDPQLATQLTQTLAGLERRGLDVDGVIGLGEGLADLLLPDDVRDLLVRSLDRLTPEQGLRLRLRLDPLLAGIPWEFVFVPRQHGQRDATGFLALDPRISIVRHQTVTGAVPVAGPPRERRIVVALASPLGPDIAVLDLATERANIAAALAGAPGLTAEYVTDATVETLTAALSEGTTDVFHFAGHGLADEIVLEGVAAAPVRFPADQLAVNLQSRGTLLAVLGACDTGRRADDDAWSGVATRLIGAGVGAAVAMQYTIGDRNAIEFGSSFYRALAAGIPIDGAVAAGRLAIFNRMHPVRDDPQRAGFWRDWGVPVLYQRPGAAVTLTVPDGAATTTAKDDARKVATVLIDNRIGTIGPAGSYVGAEVGVMHSGVLDSRLRADLVQASVVGAQLEKVEAGKVHVALDIERADAPITGVKITDLG